MEITKELIEKTKKINSILLQTVAVIDPQGNLHKVQEVETIEQQYDIESSDNLEDIITSEFENSCCGIYISLYPEYDSCDDVTFITLKELVAQNYKFLKLITVHP